MSRTQVRKQIQQAPRRRHKRLLRRCRHLAQIIEQDLETDEEGRLAVARKVAKDRIVSLTDPCARHGRKSKTFTGFKVHVLGDVVSGLITAVSVTKGNRRDGLVAHRLIRRAKILADFIEVVLRHSVWWCNTAAAGGQGVGCHDCRSAAIAEGAKWRFTETRRHRNRFRGPNGHLCCWNHRHQAQASLVICAPV